MMIDQKQHLSSSVIKKIKIKRCHINPHFKRHSNGTQLLKYLVCIMIWCLKLNFKALCVSKIVSYKSILTKVKPSSFRLLFSRFVMRSVLLVFHTKHSVSRYRLQLTGARSFYKICRANHIGYTDNGFIKKKPPRQNSAGESVSLLRFDLEHSTTSQHHHLS
jgi:hypothetical protein